jgi:phosphotransferase system HPr (HPr) family protein
VTVRRTLIVENPNGLHARPAMKVVETAGGFAADLILRRPDGDADAPAQADAKSVLQVITLGATQGTRLDLLADGDDAEPAADAIEKLFVEHFGEDE